MVIGILRNADCSVKVIFLGVLLAACVPLSPTYIKLKLEVPGAIRWLGSPSFPSDCDFYDLRIIGWSRDSKDLVVNYCTTSTGLALVDAHSGKLEPLDIPGRADLYDHGFDVNSQGKIAYAIQTSDPMEFESEGIFEVYDPNRYIFRRSPTLQDFQAIRGFALSPEGDRIAFGKNRYIEIINIMDGEGEVVYEPDRDPKYQGFSYEMMDWSADGEKIAYISIYGLMNDQYEVGVIDLSDGTSARLFEGELLVFDLTWSPDSRFIAVDYRDRLTIYDPEMDCTVGSIPMNVLNLKWSHDGGTIATIMFSHIWHVFMVDVEQAFGAPMEKLSCK